MEWSREVPRVEGFYWAIFPYIRTYPEITIVEIKSGYISIPGTDMDVAVKEATKYLENPGMPHWFMGPLEKPEPPEGVTITGWDLQ